MTREAPDRATQALPVYQRAAEIAATAEPGFRLTVGIVEELASVALGTQSTTGPIYAPPSRRRPIHAGPGRPDIDVGIELECAVERANVEIAAGRHLRGAAHVLWRVPWVHGFVDANGRTSRATSMLVLALGDARLRAANLLRAGAIGHAHLLLPERLGVVARDRYLKTLNNCHAAANARDPYLDVVDLRAVERLLTEVVEDQVAGRATPKIAPTTMTEAREQHARCVAAIDALIKAPGRAR